MIIALMNFFLFARVDAVPIDTIVNSGLAQSQNVFSKSVDELGKHIPKYESGIEGKTASEFAAINDSHLKQKGQESIANTPVISDTMKKDPLPGYENLEAFKRAEPVWADPAANLQNLFKDCTEKANKQTNPYSKRNYTKLEADADEEIRTCEKPSQNIKCEKTLEVICSQGGEINCGYNAGGIEEGSIDTGISWEYSYPYLRIGSKTGTWHFHGYQGSCDKVVQRARFKVHDLANVKKFTLHKLSYDDHAMVRINGQVVHNTLGGDRLEITGRYYGSGRPGRADLIIASDKGSGPCWRLFPTAGMDHYDDVNKDIIAHLKEGWNEVEIELVYSWEGQVNAIFEAEQYCCSKFEDKWVKRCWAS